MDLGTDLRLPRMLGSSLAAPGAALWVTDFLAAAYYAQPAEVQDVATLRLATTILATRWERTGRRLGARDLPAFARALGGLRLARTGGRFGTLGRDALLEGGGRLFGGWFPDAAADPDRRAYGIVFETTAARTSFVPERRLEIAAIAPLTPPRRTPAEQRWHTYPSVTFAPDVLPRVLALLQAPERWPDFASALGRFAPLHSGGLRGQTFEIDVAIDPLARAPLWTRGYVTATRVLTGDDARAYVDGLTPHLDNRVVPAGGTTHAAIALVTHRGHFLGRAISRLVVFEHDGAGHVCDVGSWDPLPPLAGVGYRLAGRRAQHRFWSDEEPRASMLAQLAEVAAGTASG